MRGIQSGIPMWDTTEPHHPAAPSRGTSTWGGAMSGMAQLSVYRTRFLGHKFVLRSLA